MRLFFWLAPLLWAGMVCTSLAQTTKLRLVEVISSPDRTRLLRTQLDQFERLNPGVAVELVTVPWDGAFEKTLLMFKSGQAPDVVEMPDRWGALYIRGKQLLALDNYLMASKELATLQPVAHDVARFNTQSVYQIPHGFYVKALIYNKKMLAKAGVAVPTTVDEFSKAVATVSQKLPGKYGYCLRGGKGAGYEWMQHPMEMGATGTFFDKGGRSLYAGADFQKGMQKLVDFYQKGYAPKESIAWGFNEVVTGFYSGTCAMLTQDVDALIGIAGKMDPHDFGAAPMPVSANGHAYSSLGFAGWSVSANSGHKTMAWKLVQFLTASPQNLQWAKLVGVLPVHQGAQVDPSFAGEHWAAWFKTLQNKEVYKPYMAPLYLPEWGQLYDKTMVEDGQAMLLGKRSVAQVAKEWANTLGYAQRKFETER
jgi:multiple sugar transport system substrate-binding protein